MTTMCLDRASFLLMVLCNSISIQRITSYSYKIVCVGVSQMLVSKICKRVAERVHSLATTASVVLLILPPIAEQSFNHTTVYPSFDSESTRYSYRNL